MRTLLIPFLLVIAIASCSTVDEDCMCTEEYRFFLVTVVDTMGVPVDSLTIMIKDKDGDELDVQQQDQIFGPGKYTVLDDSFTKMFVSPAVSEKVTFTATDGTRNVTGEYLFNTDKCRCHINKVSGLDTLVLR